MAGTALVTLAIGEKYISNWRAQAEKGWRGYARRHGFDLVLLTEPLDLSPRAKARSPAWQKCLVLREAVAGHYDRVVWADSDIAINPEAPSIVAGVPPAKIGVIDEHRFPTGEVRRKILERLIRQWEGRNPAIAENWRSFLSPPRWHRFFGLPERGDAIVQTGVMVLNPALHREVLEHVYHSYEDVGGEPMNYEMRPLSFEIQERQLPHWIDRRFNALVSMLLLEREVVGGSSPTTEAGMRDFLAKAFKKNYFLHFAGRQDLMPMLQTGPRPLAKGLAFGR